MTNKKKVLEVGEAFHSDIGRGIARIDTKSMKELGLNSGDFIHVKGERTSVIKVMSGFPEDEDLGIIRLDSVSRKNAKTSLNERVEIEKVEIGVAKTVHIQPTESVKFSSDPTKIFKEKLMSKGVSKGDLVYFNIMGTTLHYVVKKVSPNKQGFISSSTKLVVSEEVSKKSGVSVAQITYEEIGGLRDEVSKIREMVEIPMKHPEVFESLGITAPKGVLLHGSPGTGKTLLAKAVANEIEGNFHVINGPEIMSKFHGESEKHLRDIFEEAESNSPSIIFIDEIDSIAPNRENAQGEVERRVVSQMLTVMDGLKGRGDVVVIAATNRPNSIDPALRRPGRFDREISINPPNRKGRKEILEIHTKGMPLGDDVNLEEIANKTHGFTGADLEILTKEAAILALKKYMPDLIKFEEKVPTNVLETIRVKKEHFDSALNKVEPSAMREVLITKPNVKWDDIGGLDKVKGQIREMVELPLRQPELFVEAGVKPPKGILLAGPPGTGKTMLAKAVATESEANFISIKGPELISKWVGESEKAVREIFKKAKQVAPTVIFFDEFDSIGSLRGTSVGSDVSDKVVNQLLTELDGVEELNGVSVIAATNRVDLVDKALLRPGRLDQVVEFELPDEKTREEILGILTKNMPILKKVNFKKLSEKMENFSGAQISGVCQNVGIRGIREKVSGNSEKIEISEKMFLDEIEKVKQFNKKF